MSDTIARTLDELAGWRASLDRALSGFARTLDAHELLDDAGSARVAALRRRLGDDRLVLAFVAETSRGKSELINALLFADAGRRVLPATPGRTTMCPLEIAHDPALPPRLALLPIETRLHGQALADLRGRDQAWQVLPLPGDDPAALAAALSEVTRTRPVDVGTAQALGLWHPEQPDLNPPLCDDGRVEVPAWRHALINHPHPLLRRGLVVVDTPGLNAIGAEPELTVGLLPSADAVVFVLAADTGVSRSDLEIWRDCVAERGFVPFVVLNKIDALADPLLGRDEVEAQIDRQCADAARLLAVDPARVFPLSAREALAARIAGDDDARQRSRIGALEEALVAGLLPRRQAVLQAAAADIVERLRDAALRRLGDQRRQNAEQLLELRALRGRSTGKVALLLRRVDAEGADFDRCLARIAALRSVQTRLLRGALEPLDSDRLRAELDAMVASCRGRPFHLGAGKAFASSMARVRQSFARAAAAVDELAQMLDGSFQRLNAEFGFAFALPPAPDFGPGERVLSEIEAQHARLLSVSQAWRLAQPGYVAQFARALLARLRAVFEAAAGDVELWSRAATAPIDSQLRERRRAFRRRREALGRIQGAAGDLEQRIDEVESRDRSLAALERSVAGEAAEVLAPGAARQVPAEAGPGPGASGERVPRDVLAATGPDG
ncbi:MAG: dynamin family protein [Rubrivivax sp.]|jgi:hypothetical protein|nr:dynamin family protein [Rubrivivax sp.]